MGGAHAQTLKNSLTLAAVEGIPTSTNGPGPNPYRGTSLVRKYLPVGPYSSPMPMVLRWS